MRQFRYAPATVGGVERRAHGRAAWAARLSVAIGLFALVAAGTGVAQTTGPSGGEQPEVDLDRLLRLPDSYEAGGAQDQKRGGASELEWRERFREAHSALEEAEAALQQSQAELEHAASETGNYQVSAPGVTNPQNSPVNFGLQQKIREQRATIDERRRTLRKLEIDADLAGVPANWREPPAATK